MDDDCQTDEDQNYDAFHMMKTEVEEAINRYVIEKKDGTCELFIKNLYGERRFRNAF